MMNNVKNDIVRCTRNDVWLRLSTIIDKDIHNDIGYAMNKKGIHIFIFDATNAVVLNSLNRIIKNET